jgi:hypothetical protein
MEDRESEYSNNDAIDTDSEMGTASDTDSVDSQERRVRKDPRWKFGRFFSAPEAEEGGDSIWCWPVPRNDLHGHRTQVWKFVRRDGQWVYGTDPLSFFGDWDSMVDTAIPCPKSDGLDLWADFTKLRLCENCDRSRAKCVKALLGDTVDLLWQISPPDGAVKFAEWEKKTNQGQSSREGGGVRELLRAPPTEHKAEQQLPEKQQQDSVVLSIPNL